MESTGVKRRRRRRRRRNVLGVVFWTGVVGTYALISSSAFFLLRHGRRREDMPSASSSSKTLSGFVRQFHNAVVVPSDDRAITTTTTAGAEDDDDDEEEEKEEEEASTTIASTRHREEEEEEDDEGPRHRLCQKPLRLDGTDNTTGGGGGGRTTTMTIIVFLHVPKTGGTTLRHRFSRSHYPHITRWVSIGLTEARFQRHVHVVERLLYLSQQNQNQNDDGVLFWEIHGVASSVLVTTLPEALRDWRGRAGVVVLAFTVVREGAAAATSFWNFYCPPCDDTRLFGPSSGTVTGDGDGRMTAHEDEEDDNNNNNNNNNTGGWNRFVRARSAWSDFQTRFLLHGDYGDDWHHHHDDTVSSSITPLWRRLTDSMDWIGTTETLSQTTVPLLAYLVTSGDARHMRRAYRDPPPAKNVRRRRQQQRMTVSNVDDNNTNSNDDDAVVDVDRMDDAKLAWLQDEMALDRTLWNMVQRDYHWDMNEPDVLWVPCR